MSQSAENDAPVGECLWANQICEQPNHHGCLTCLAVEPIRPIPPGQTADNDAADEPHRADDCALCRSFDRLRNAPWL